MPALKVFVFHLKDLLNSSPDKVIITDPEWKIAFINDDFLSFAGLDRKDKSKQDLNYLLGSEQLKELDTELRSNIVCNREFQFRSSKTKQKVFSFNLYYRKTIIGHVITIPAQLENKLETKNDLFQFSLLRAMNIRSDKIWFITNILTGKNLFVSDSIKTLLGWEIEFFSLGGWSFFFSLIHYEDLPNMFARNAEWMLMKAKLGLLYEHVQFTSTFRIRNFSGEYVPLETESNVLERNESGMIKLVLGSFQFIDSKTMETRINNQISSPVKIIDGKTFVDMDYLRQLREQRVENSHRKVFKDLSQREFETLELIVDGYNSQEISEKLRITIHTVNLHRKQIMKKLGVKNLAALLKIYYTSK